MRYLVVFDDTMPKSEVIVDVIGNKGFADVVVKRKTLFERFQEQIVTVYKDAEFIKTTHRHELEDVLGRLERAHDEDVRILHYFSNSLVSDIDRAKLTFDKLSYVTDSLALMLDSVMVGVMFANIGEYCNYLAQVIAAEDHSVSNGYIKSIKTVTPIEGITNIGEINNFIQCITGNFDARYFNSLQGDEYTIVKSSTNKEKIKAEYTFWHLLPEDMQFWFVEPFDYREDDERASYTMERLYMTDLAIKWVHGSIDEKELNIILEKYFYFFNHRHKKSVSQEEYKRISDLLYRDKVIDRVEELKKLPQYTEISKLLSINDNLSIDDLVNKYLTLKDKLESKIKQDNFSVIGHGDPCFANTMYNKSTRTLKFIDPKGATSEEQLWTNPYYDIAKLSHSICGRYDFFNNGLFEININSDFGTELVIDFDNTKYIELFRQKVEENGYNYWLVRLYEASLFISMLPLHIDNPHKVFGFILNANNILKEIEANV